MNGTFAVPGAQLYYQVRGRGPVLLMMSGGHGDADSFDGVAEHLAEQYTVMTYDRRGYARSPLDDPAREQPVATHADDAAALLARSGPAPAQVFANSAGALVALDLATRHAALVSTLVAHEPPALYLLPAAERPQPPDELIATMRRDGESAAMQGFRALIGADPDDHEPGVDLARQRSPRAAANTRFFLGHELAMLNRYRPDIAALRAGPTRIVPAGGRTGQDRFPYRCAAALARRLGVSIVDFPGGHAGFVTHPNAFGAHLRLVLARVAGPAGRG